MALLGYGPSLGNMHRVIETANWPLSGYGTSPEAKESGHPNTKGSQSGVLCPDTGKKETTY